MTTDRAAAILTEQTNREREHREEAENKILFLFPELRESFTEAQRNNCTSMSSGSCAGSNHHHSNNNSSSSTIRLSHESGVLWKRRDVFKNRWRPRWFALHPGQGVLNYYLLTGDVVAEVGTPRSASAGGGGSMMMSSSSSNNNNNNSSSATSRGRTFSWESAVSENTLDYDVVPRGTIYLLGCSVAQNDAVSKPSEGLYAFTIASNVDAAAASGATHIHLAARTPELRDRWVEKIDRVCRVARTPPPSTSTTTTPNSNNRIHATREPSFSGSIPQEIPAHLRTPTNQRLFEHRHSIPEGDFEDASNADIDISALLDGEDNNIDDDVAVPGDTWISLGLARTLHEGVPEALAQQIQERLDRYLPLCEERENDSTGGRWKRLFLHENGHAAYQNLLDDKRMVKSVAVLPHPPKQVFSLLIDVTRRQSYETNVRTAERMKHLNPYSFLDHYTYFPVWPTAAREFAVCTHWEIVGQRGDNNDDDERAIAIVSFSCPEADALKPATSSSPKHVRANLFCSMYLLRPVRRSVDNEEHTHFVRLLSFDLAGGVTQHMSNVISTQQANIPAVIAEYLQRHEPVIENRYRGDVLTNETVVANVIDRLGPAAAQPRLNNGESFVVNGDSDTAKLANEKDCSSNELPSIESQAVILLAPVFVYKVLAFFNSPFSALVFCVGAFLAIRQVVVWHIGEAVPSSDDPVVIGPITCRFSVDLKGVLRFIANKREEREEQNTGTAEVSIVHIVACSLARALRKESLLRRRRVRIPWLWIDTIVDASAESVDISVSENAGGVVTLKGLDRKNVQCVADELAVAEQRTSKTTEVGQCLVLATSDCDDSDIVLEAAPVHPNVTVVAVVGGVHLVHSPPKSPRASNGRVTPRPVLVLSLTITGHNQADLVCCRRFASEVRKLLAFPEMCE